MVTIILALGLGYVIGLLQKGIHIHHVQPQKEENAEPVYNEAYSDGVPLEIKNYYEQTKGFTDI